MEKAEEVMLNKDATLFENERKSMILRNHTWLGEKRERSDKNSSLIDNSGGYIRNKNFFLNFSH